MYSKKMVINLLVGLLLIGTVGTTAVAASDDIDTFFPKQQDPFVGNYVGRWSDDIDINPEIAAQIIALGRDTYQIRLVNKLDMRCPPDLLVEVERKGKKLSFKEGRLEGETDGKTFTGRKSSRTTFSMKKVERTSPTMGANPPEGAVVLFDGSDMNAWTGTEGWQILDNNVLMVTPDGDYLISKQKYTDVQLHVEFRSSWMPKARGQNRANSGVFLQDEYEVQVLDSFGLEGYYNECGALYKVAAPKVNACAPPLVWQTYDITFRAARFDNAGKLIENPRITVFHNGVPIHKDQELWWITGWKEKDRLAPHIKEPGSIKLQGHNNYVQFRNIWLVDLSQSK